MQAQFSHFPSLLQSTTAVTLVAHGLNVKPEAMLPLARWLTSKGSDVYLVKLSGHQEYGAGFIDVKCTVWQQEMLTVYLRAMQAAVGYSVPLFFLGYSLGALLGQSMIGLGITHAPFAKQVLFAPAIALRRRSYIIKLLFLISPKMVLPSFTPKGYRINDAIPLVAYEILFAEEEKVIKSGYKTLNVPTLVIMDEKDELISYKKLVGRIKKFGLNNCRMVTVLSDRKERQGQYHHLIIDEQTLGRNNWEMVTSEMEQFLFGNGV